MNPDKDLQCLKRIRDQGSGQKALPEDETPPCCAAKDEKENSWMTGLIA